MVYARLREGRASASLQVYVVTTVTQGRAPLFTEFVPARLVVSEMRRLHDLGLVSSLAWVLMPEHLHWMFALGTARTLSQVVQLLKGRSARRLGELTPHVGPVWQPNFFDRAVRRDDDLAKAARYIVANPLRRGLVNRIGDWPHWDAIWL